MVIPEYMRWLTLFRKITYVSSTAVTACRGSAIAQEDVELVTAAVWSTFLHTLCHAVYSGPAWIIWIAVLLIISSTFPSIPHNYSSMSLLHTTSGSTSTPPRRSNVPLYDYTKAICTSLKTSAHACKHVQDTKHPPPTHNDIFVLYIYSSVSICLPQSESLACPWTISNFSHTHPYLSVFIQKSSRVNGLIAAVVSVSLTQLHSQIKFKQCLFSSPRNKYIFI